MATRLPLTTNRPPSISVNESRREEYEQTELKNSLSTFSGMLVIPFAVDNFAQFLADSHALELMLFFTDVQEYKKMGSVLSAQFAKGAEKKKVESAIATDPKQVAFDQLLERIQLDLETVHYPSFLSSKYYSNSLMKITPPIIHLKDKPWRQSLESMKANKNVVITLGKEAELREVLLTEPSSREVLIKMECSGLGTNDGMGTVVGAGHRVINLKVGDKVAIEPYIPCNLCKLCKSGHYNRCPDIKTQNILSKFILHPAHLCHKLPESITHEEGSLVSWLASGVYAIKVSGVGCGDRILVLGNDDNAFSCLVAAKLSGASVCLISDSLDALALSKNLGAMSYYSSLFLTVIGINIKDRNEAQIAMDIVTNFGSVDAIFICSLKDGILRASLRTVVSGGTVAFISSPKSDIINKEINVSDVINKELKLLGVKRHANIFPICISLLERKSLDLSILIFHRYTLSHITEAYNLYKQGKFGKIVIHME